MKNILIKKIKLSAMILLLITLTIPFSLFSQKLHVSPDGHRLVKEDGSVFFYMADTGWELFHRLNKDETLVYLNDRKANGFNVIQAVILAELDGLNTPNAEGEKPFLDKNYSKPNEKYFEHVDWVLNKAEELGLYIAFLPTWGDKWNLQWGVGPVIFNTPEKTKKFFQWIGKRYKDQPNILWILGGDRVPESPEQLKIVEAMAEGIKAGDKGRHLVSYHPWGGTCSSEWFHNENWLDFNFAQTGHSEKNNPVYKMMLEDYYLKPTKPVINGEPQYEDHPINFTPQNERFEAFDVRQAGYWSVLSGTAGHTYGNHNIWQMWQPGRQPITAARIPWYAAIYQPGAAQMGFMRKLFESRNFMDMIPDQDVLADVFGQNKNEIRAARGKDSSFVIVYTPHGNPVHLKMEKLSGSSISGYWYNPREGTSLKIEPFENPKKAKAFVPPSSGQMTDWVLVLDDDSKNYPDPASRELK